MQKIMQKIKNWFSFDNGYGWLLVFVLTQTFASIPAMWITAVKNFDMKIYDMSTVMTELAEKHMTEMSSWAMLIAGIIFLALYIPWKILKKEKFDILNTNKDVAIFSVLSGMFFNAVMISVGMILIVLMNADGAALSGTGSLLLSSDVTWLTIIATGIFAPIQEEIGFRRGLTVPLAKKGKIGFAIVLSSIVFAFAHAGPFQMIFTFILGLFMSYLILTTGNVVYPILVHVGMNLLSSVAVLFEFHELLIILVGGVAFIIATIMIYKNEAVNEVMEIKENLARVKEEKLAEYEASKAVEKKPKKEKEKDNAPKPCKKGTGTKKKHKKKKKK